MARRNERRSATVRSFVTSATTTGRLIAGRRLSQPRTHLARRLVFADGTTSFVFRETALRGAPTVDPAVLVVQFRLRMVGTSPLWHALFRRECVLHTPLFGGFRGFRSKLWLTDLRTGVYRGLYQWDGADLAVDYAATLTRLLRAVSVAESVDHHVIPGVRRDDLLRDPARVSGGREWWRLVASSASASWSG